MTRPEKESVLHEEETVDSIAITASQTPKKEAKEEEEDDFEERFQRYWGKIPESFSEIVFGEGWFGDGHSLMEIFDVRLISNHRKHHKLNINGTVTVDASYGITDLFRRPPENPEVIHSGESLTLMGPDIFAPADGYNLIDLDIKDGRRQISKGSVLWSIHHANFAENKPVTRKVPGNYGHALVTYAVFSRAILISVEIKLPKMEVFDFKSSKKIDPIKVYGQIDFTIKGLTTFDHVTTTLFRRKHTNSASVSAEGGFLPLSKSLISFPRKGTAEVSVYLKEHLMCKSGNCNVAIGSVSHKPECFGDHELEIDSKYGPIKVKLTAHPTYMHPKSVVALKQKIALKLKMRKCI